MYNKWCDKKIEWNKSRHVRNKNISTYFITYLEVNIYNFFISKNVKQNSLHQPKFTLL